MCGHYVVHAFPLMRPCSAGLGCAETGLQLLEIKKKKKKKVPKMLMSHVQMTQISGKGL